MYLNPSICYLGNFLVEQPLQRRVGGVGERGQRGVLPHHVLPVLCHDGRAQHRRRAAGGKENIL